MITITLYILFTALGFPSYFFALLNLAIFVSMLSVFLSLTVINVTLFLCGAHGCLFFRGPHVFSFYICVLSVALFFCGDLGCFYSSCGGHGFLLFAVLIVAAISLSLSLIRCSWPTIYYLVIILPSRLLPSLEVQCLPDPSISYNPLTSYTMHP